MRKRIEEPFGWMKTIGGLRKARNRGCSLMERFFELTATSKSGFSAACSHVRKFWHADGIVVNRLLAGRNKIAAEWGQSNFAAEATKSSLVAREGRVHIAAFLGVPLHGTTATCRRKDRRMFRYVPQLEIVT
jgi:hypothetical protein